MRHAHVRARACAWGLLLPQSSDEMRRLRLSSVRAPISDEGERRHRCKGAEPRSPGLLCWDGRSRPPHVGVEVRGGSEHT